MNFVRMCHYLVFLIIGLGGFIHIESVSADPAVEVTSASTSISASASVSTSASASASATASATATATSAETKTATESLLSSPVFTSKGLAYQTPSPPIFPTYPLNPPPKAPACVLKEGSFSNLVQYPFAESIQPRTVVLLSPSNHPLFKEESYSLSSGGLVGKHTVSLSLVNATSEPPSLLLGENRIESCSALVPGYSLFYGGRKDNLTCDMTIVSYDLSIKHINITTEPVLFSSSAVVSSIEHPDVYAVVFAGGHFEDRPSSTIKVWHSETPQQLLLPQDSDEWMFLDVPRWGMASAAMSPGVMLIFAGGCTEYDKYSDVVELLYVNVYRKSMDIRRSNFQTRIPSGPRAFMAGAVVKGRYYFLAGGHTPDSLKGLSEGTDLIEVYDMEKNKWLDILPSPWHRLSNPRGYPIFSAVDFQHNYVFFAGGSHSAPEVTLNSIDVCALDPNNDGEIHCSFLMIPETARNQSNVMEVYGLDITDEYLIITAAISPINKPNNTISTTVIRFSLCAVETALVFSLSFWKTCDAKVSSLSHSGGWIYDMTTFTVDDSVFFGGGRHEVLQKNGSRPIQRYDAVTGEDFAEKQALEHYGFVSCAPGLPTIRDSIFFLHSCLQDSFIDESRQITFILINPPSERKTNWIHSVASVELEYFKFGMAYVEFMIRGGYNYYSVGGINSFDPNRSKNPSSKVFSATMTDTYPYGEPLAVNYIGEAVAYATASVIKDFLYVAGGIGGNLKVTNRIQCLHDKNFNMRLTYPRAFHASLTVGNIVAIGGGQSFVLPFEDIKPLVSSFPGGYRVSTVDDASKSIEIVDVVKKAIQVISFSVPHGRGVVAVSVHDLLFFAGGVPVTESARRRRTVDVINVFTKEHNSFELPPVCDAVMALLVTANKYLVFSCETTAMKGNKGVVITIPPAVMTGSMCSNPTLPSVPKKTPIVILEEKGEFPILLVMILVSSIFGLMLIFSVFILIIRKRRKRDFKAPLQFDMSVNSTDDIATWKQNTFQQFNCMSVVLESMDENESEYAVPKKIEHNIAIPPEDIYSQIKCEVNLTHQTPVEDDLSIVYTSLDSIDPSRHNESSSEERVIYSHISQPRGRLSLPVIPVSHSNASEVVPMRRTRHLE